MRRPSLGRVLGGRELGLAVALAAAIGIIVLCGRGEAFFGTANRTALLRQIGLQGVLAVGSAVVIIAGGIDLSVGSVVAFCGMLCALGLTRGAAAAGWADPPPGALLAALGGTLCLGVLIGAFHATLICRLALPPFIATLATLAGLRSATQLVTRSVPVPVPFDSFRHLAAGLTPLWFCLAVAAAIALLMRATAVGRQLYALGGNEEAARLSGLSPTRLKHVAYILSATCAALGGVLYAAYTGQGDPRTGVAFELQAIAACVVGGCSLQGGVGSITGTLLGVALLQTVLNGIGLVIRADSTLWEGVVVGVVVILAVALNRGRGA